MLALALLAAVVAGASSGATKPIKVSLVRKPAATAGLRSVVSLAVRGSARPVRLTLRAQSGPTVRLVTARRITARLYRARPTFPFAGRWKLTALARGRRFALGAAVVHPAPPVQSAIPGAAATRICRAPGAPLPQYSLAYGLGSLWVGCRQAQAAVLKVDPGSGQVRGLLDVPSVDPDALAAGVGALWVAQRSSVVARIDPRTGATRAAVVLGSSAYVFTLGGSVWTPDDSRSTLIRFTPGGQRAELAVGNGTAALVESGSRIWIMNHRDATLERIDLTTNAVTRLATLPGGGAPERMVLVGGSLWITGRGTDLLRVDPETGAVQQTIEIGAGGINIAAGGGSIWVFVATEADDRAGLPILDRVLRVDPATKTVAEVIRPTARVAVTGVTSDGAHVWLADTAAGRLYRFG